MMECMATSASRTAVCASKEYPVKSPQAYTPGTEVCICPLTKTFPFYSGTNPKPHFSIKSYPYKTLTVSDLTESKFYSSEDGPASSKRRSLK